MRGGGEAFQAEVTVPVSAQSQGRHSAVKKPREDLCALCPKGWREAREKGLIQTRWDTGHHLKEFRFWF